MKRAGVKDSQKKAARQSKMLERPSPKPEQSSETLLGALEKRANLVEQWENVLHLRKDLYYKQNRKHLSEANLWAIGVEASKT